MSIYLSVACELWAVGCGRQPVGMRSPIYDIGEADVVVVMIVVVVAVEFY